MTARANYFKIGVFIIAATCLGVVGLIAMGAGALLQERVRIETYFDESVQGLDVGSKVKFRGVEVGNVSDIGFAREVFDDELAFSSAENRYVVVGITLDPEQFRGQTLEAIGTRLRQESERGLRTRLAMQGVTGSAYIEVDYMDPPPPPPEISWVPGAPYIPSAPSIVTRFTESLDGVLRTLESADLQAITENLERGLESLATALADTRVDEISANAVALLSELRETNAIVQASIEELRLPELAGDAAATVAGARAIVESSQARIETILTEFEAASESARRVTDRLDEILASAQLERTLEGVSVAAHNAGAASEQLPETMALLNRTLRRIDMVVGSDASELSVILHNFRVASENLREITADAKRYPAATLFGSAPRPASPMRKKNQP